MWAPEPVGHAARIEGLWAARAAGRLSHALLFHGPEGVGKFVAARWFVQGLYCEQGPAAPCGVCGACRRLEAGSHPDLLVLDPLELGEENLGVGYISPREGGPKVTVEGFLALRAAEGGVRVVLLREFERAGIQTQNALLKTLEEPGEDTLLLLESSRPDLLLETVRSRCVAVGFGGLSEEEATLVLARGGVVGPAAEACARLADGAPGRALALAREGAPAVLELLEDVIGGRRDPLATTAELLSREAEFAGKTPTAKLRARARAALDLALGRIHAAARARAGDSAGAEELPWSERTLARTAQVLLSSRAELELNLSAEGALDRALLALREGGRATRAGART